MAAPNNRVNFKYTKYILVRRGGGLSESVFIYRCFPNTHHPSRCTRYHCIYNYGL